MTCLAIVTLSTRIKIEKFLHLMCFHCPMQPSAQNFNHFLAKFIVKQLREWVRSKVINQPNAFCSNFLRIFLIFFCKKHHISCHFIVKQLREWLRSKVINQPNTICSDFFPFLLDHLLQHTHEQKKTFNADWQIFNLGFSSIEATILWNATYQYVHTSGHSRSQYKFR